MQPFAILQTARLPSVHKENENFFILISGGGSHKYDLPGLLVCTVRESFVHFQSVVGVFVIGLQAWPF
jgi:hypothetical protein